MKIIPLMAVSAALALGSANFALGQTQSPPMASPNATQNPAIKSPSDMTGAPLAKGHNSFTKKEARSRLKKAGYMSVTDLAKDSDGLWQAHATKDGQPVSVALDFKGNVSTK